MDGDDVPAAEGMGSPTISLEALLADGLGADPRAAAEATAAAEAGIVQSVASEGDYWGRLSSAVFCEDVPEERVASVAAEFKDYALFWCRYGRGLNLITDFAAHIKVRADRFERREERRRQKRAAALGLLCRPATSSAPPARALPPTKAPPPPLDLFEALPSPPQLRVDAHAALALLAAGEESLARLAGDIAATVAPLDAACADAVSAAYEHMMAVFMEPRLKRRYGYNGSDHAQRPLVLGSDVPNYFANVGGQSIHRRKVLSMAGLHNLVRFGPTIYGQLRDKQFHGAPDAYSASEGLQLMRRVTGNAVDLDTTVLRCTDAATLNAINASNRHKGLPTYRTSDAFAASEQAQDIAMHCSLPLLADFAARLNLNEEQQRARLIHPSQVRTPCPVASNNADRGRACVWQYVNAGQNSFHANVPCMEDVNGALLRAPLHCAKHWIHLHAFFRPGPELDERIDGFFEHCVADTCFNMKWKSIEDFGQRLAHEGTVVDVLQRLQADAQATFTEAFFDGDNDAHDAEIAEMWRLANGKVGREKTGKIRPITREDVNRWVGDPSVAI